MTTKRTRLVAWVLSALVISSPVVMMALSQKLIFANLRGSLHVVQAVPCGGMVDVTTSIADGRMDITPTQLSRTDAIGARFDLTSMQLWVTPFSVEHECFGLKATAAFQEIGVTLVRPVTFTGEPIGGPEDRKYRFTIPKQQVLLFESVLDNLPVPQPEQSYQRPAEDVTGEIDLRRRSAELHIVLASKLRFRVGCIGNKCVINELLEGRQTADVAGIVVNTSTDSDGDGVADLNDNCPLVPNGDQANVATPLLTPPAAVTVSSCQGASIGVAHAEDVCHARPVAITSNAPAKFPVGRSLVTWMANDGIDPPVTATQSVNVDVVDHTAPVVACRALKTGGMFHVMVDDDCDGRTIARLGSYEIASGEVIKIEVTGKPGVRQLGTVGTERTRFFQVGKTDGVIVATDASGNVARAFCGIPLDIVTFKR